MKITKWLEENKIPDAKKENCKNFLDAERICYETSINRTYDIKLINLLLKEELTVNQKFMVENSILFLTNNINKRLPNNVRNRYKYWLEGITRSKVLMAKGVPSVPKDKWKKRKYVNSKHIKQPLPEWMNNPDLLPKKPPGVT